MKKYTVILTQDEKKNLETITRKGSHRSQKVLNALILLVCAEGEFQDRRAKNEEIATVLKVSMKKIEIKPWKKQGWVIPPEQNGQFVADMEHVLDVYKRPYDQEYPVVCMDESPKQLIKETHTPLAAKPGRL